MCKYTSWPCKWTVTVHICTVTVHHVINFFIFFFSSLFTFDSPHSLFLISFLTSLSPINSLSKPINLSYPTIRSASLIKYNNDSNGPWFRLASLISDHMKSTDFLGRPWSGDPRPWLSERRWFQWVCSIWSLMVASGWVWVILGLCWVSSSTEKTVAGWVWLDGEEEFMSLF